MSEKNKSKQSNRRYRSESPEYKRRKKEEKIQTKELFKKGLEDIQSRELRFSIPGGNEFKLARVTGINKEIPTEAFDGYYNSNKPKHVYFDYIVLKNEKIKQGKLNKKVYTPFKELQKSIKGKENKTMAFLKKPEGHFHLKIWKTLEYGLYAKKKIEKDQVIGEYSGEIIIKEDEKRRMETIRERELSNYMYETCRENVVIDGGPIGNYMRYINHSCNQNCKAIFTEVEEDGKSFPRNFIKTTRTIAKGEQIFLNYGKAYFQNQNLKCMCDEKNCFSKN